MDLVIDQTLGLLEKIDSGTLIEGKSKVAKCEDYAHQEDPPAD